MKLAISLFKLDNKDIHHSIFTRLCVSFTAVTLPIILLAKGIYGSLLFTFSISFFWQIGIRGKSIHSLGLRRERIGYSIIAGLITGCSVGLIGGNLLRLAGITGYAFTNSHKLQWSFGFLNIAFSLHNELGYQLLIKSNTLAGACIYFIFSIFAIGLGEELFWRGFIQRKISRYLSINASIWLTAILFALFHFYIFTILPIKTGVVFLFMIILVGASWGFLFEYFNNIWVSAISHGIIAFIIWKYYFFAIPGS